MLQKAPSNTTSSEFVTNKPIQFLKGVGPGLAAAFEAKGIRTVEDALYYFPRDYQDRSNIKKTNEVVPGEKALIYGQIISHRLIPLRNRKRPLLEATLEDAGGRIKLKWFQFTQGFFEKKFSGKPFVLIYGEAHAFGAIKEIIHPEMEWDLNAPEAGNLKGIVPVYSESERLNQRLIRKVVGQAVVLGLDQLEDELPLHVREQYALPHVRDAVLKLHRPDSDVDIEKLKNFTTLEQKRLIFEEFFKFEWIVGKRRLNLRSESTKPYPVKACQTGLLSLTLSRQPFELTDDQKTAVKKIHEDLCDTKPMNRLLQGEVGCGKTLVAFLSAIPVIAGGGQVALMAPTEILAQQHFLNAQIILEGFRLGFLAGSTTKSQRDKILDELALGKIDLLIGTHALLEEPVVFKELGFVIFDEQHRFGVDQRMRLRAKGRHPHILSMTATPIPRTLALTAYGDLDVTTIRQLPKGRPEVLTRLFKKSELETAYALICDELEKNHQAYVIYPLVEESEKLDLANAVQGARELASGPFKKYRVGLLHGRMPSKEKSDVMAAFKKGGIHILVSTTVVEVGVDVPNATGLVIEHAERFGLSQLHQLRGRIGRGTQKSYCMLVTHGAGEIAYQRLKAMEETRDGFKLAELDLEIRGPGEFLGTRQSGELQFKYANLIRDQSILEHSRKSAFELLQSDPDLNNPAHAPLRRYMERAGQIQQDRLGTA